MKSGSDTAVARPIHILAAVLAVFLVFLTGLSIHAGIRLAHKGKQAHLLDVVTASLGLTDLCVATEARYTRHPAVSDPVAPFMDHPGGLEHFPTGSFWVPPRLTLQEEQ